MSADFSLLTYNFVSLPWLTKKVKRRLARFLSEIADLQPEVICFQEIWLKSVRESLLEGLEKLGYRDHYFTVVENSFKGKNGFLFVSRKAIEGVATVRLISRWLGMNWSLTEVLANKGFSQAEMKTGSGKAVNLFNVHLSAQYRQDIKNFESNFNRAKTLSLKKLAVAINSLGKEKVIVAGDFNFPPNSWFYENFLAWTGMIDPSSRKWATVLPSLFRISVPKLDRTDYIFVKNFSPEEIRGVDLLWDKPFPGLGYLSDHAALLVRLRF